MAFGARKKVRSASSRALARAVVVARLGERCLSPSRPARPVLGFFACRATRTSALPRAYRMLTIPRSPPLLPTDCEGRRGHPRSL